ncbi:hypothetical protein ACIQMV_32465 [Streptomyces sp. NPDC091412]|uniref:hypothetical protein n=1 Tax=Streptomyces sp. NPDC091412 TaxID=3366002 RepID=UPI0037F9A387
MNASEIWLFKTVVDAVLAPRDLRPLLWVAPVFLGSSSAPGCCGSADDVTSTWVGERFLLSLRAGTWRSPGQ